MKRRLVTWLMLVAWLAGTAAAARDWELEVGPSAGATALDSGLADYRWDTTPRFESGVESTVGRERWRAGLRWRHSRTTQGTGLASPEADPAVQANHLELVGRWRAIRPLGVGIWTTAHAGWLNLTYSPDALILAPGWGLEPVRVEFAPVNTIGVGGGLTLRRPLGRALAVALSAEASTFALDTAHRRGDEIVSRHERFWNWSARLAVTWRADLGS